VLSDAILADMNYPVDKTRTIKTYRYRTAKLPIYHTVTGDKFYHLVYVHSTIVSNILFVLILTHEPVSIAVIVSL